MMQKLEYWAAAWGLVIMVATGFINWFPVAAANIAPGFLIPLAKSIHGWEAVLAVFWILSAHLYSAVWSRSVFPFDRSIWTGKISKERLREEHALEHEKLSQVDEIKPGKLVLDEEP
jgi:cytochrome b subunit of formate dehydrogenase